MAQTQLSHHRFKQFPVDDIDPINSTHDLAIDSEGFIWVSGKDGLLRLTGNSFVKYALPNEETSDFNRIEIVQNTLLASSGKTLAKYDPSSNSLAIVDTFSSAIIDIKTWESAPLICTESGLFYGPTGSEFFIPGTDTLRIRGFTSHNEQVWVSDHSTIYTWSKEEGFKRQANHSLHIQDLEVVDNKVWIAANSGLFILQVDGELTRIDQLTKAGTEHVSPDFRRITRFNDRIYAGSDAAGLFVFDSDGNKAEVIHPRIDNLDPLHSVWQAVEDNHQNLWLITFNHGLLLSLNGWQDVQIFDQKDVTEKIGPVVDLIEIRDQDVLVATDGNGLSILDKDQIVGVRAANAPKKPQMAVATANGSYLISTWNEGVFMYDEKAFEFQQINHWQWLDDQLPKNILTVLEDQYSRFWIGSFYDGIVMIDPAQESSIHIHSADFPSSKFNDEILSTFNVSDTTVLVNSRGGNVVFNHSGLPISVDSLKSAISNVWPDGVILYADQKQAFIDTKKGLCIGYWDGRIEPLYKTYPLVKEKIFEVQPVDDGFAISTATDLAYFKHQEGIVNVLNYNKLGFIPFGRSVLVKSNKNIVIGGINQVLECSSAFLSKSPPALSITFRGITDDQGNRLNLIKDEISRAKWAYTADARVISVESPNTTWDDNIVMEFRRDQSDEWVDISDDRTFILPHLSPGNHIFEVRVLSGSGSVAYDKLMIAVTPLFYQTIGFRIVVALMISLLMYILFKWRIRRIEIAKKNLEQIVDDRTEEIKKQSKKIERQNELLTEGLQVGQYFQESVLPKPGSMAEPFEDFGVLFKARDLVGGDFYWHYRQNQLVYIICGDCVGHGASAALLTMVAINFLNSQKQNLSADRLSQLMHQIGDLFAETFNDPNVRYGIDLSIVCLDLETDEFHYCSANGKILISHPDFDEYLTIDRYSISSITHMREVEFQQRQFKLRKGDEVFLYTDGCVDQLQRAEKVKCFGRKRLRDILLERDHPIQTRIENLEHELDLWAGTEVQTDDRLLIGFEIK